MKGSPSASETPLLSEAAAAPAESAQEVSTKNSPCYNLGLIRTRLWIYDLAPERYLELSFSSFASASDT